MPKEPKEYLGVKRYKETRFKAEINFKQGMFHVNKCCDTKEEAWEFVEPYLKYFGLFNLHRLGVFELGPNQWLAFAIENDQGFLIGKFPDRATAREERRVWLAEGDRVGGITLDETDDDGKTKKSRDCSSPPR